MDTTLKVTEQDVADWCFSNANVRAVLSQHCTLGPPRTLFELHGDRGVATFAVRDDDLAYDRKRMIQSLVHSAHARLHLPNYADARICRPDGNGFGKIIEHRRAQS